MKKMTLSETSTTTIERTRMRFRRPPTKAATRPLSPNFDSGMLPEPLIAFGGRHSHVDPKTGLSLYGPYSLIGQNRPELTSIIIGMVGPPGMVADAEQWL